MRLVAEKAAFKKQLLERGSPEDLGALSSDASISPGSIDNNDLYVGPGQPSRYFQETAMVTKAELLDAERSQLRAAQWRRFDLIEAVDTASDTRTHDRVISPDGWQQAIEDTEQQIKKSQERIRFLEGLPDSYSEPVILDGVETGAHSITYSNMTYAGSTKKDPINVFFYRVGSAYDVHFDMRFWTQLRWNASGCGEGQSVYIWDRQHSGGWDGWRDQLSGYWEDGWWIPGQLERYQDWYCGSSRYHARLFEGFVRDSHSPSFGTWSMTAAHWDNFGHRTGGYWDAAEGEVVNSFKENGRNMWFVGRIWTSFINNRDTYQESYNDGYATFIELLQ